MRWGWGEVAREKVKQNGEHLKTTPASSQKKFALKYETFVSLIQLLFKSLKVPRRKIITLITYLNLKNNCGHYIIISA